MDAAFVLAALTFAVGIGFGSWAIRGKLKEIRESTRRAPVPPHRLFAEDKRRFDDLTTERELFGEVDDEIREKEAWR